MGVETDAIRAAVAAILAQCDALDGFPQPDYSADYVAGNYINPNAFTGPKVVTSLGLSMLADRTNKLYPSNDFTSWAKSGLTVAEENGWQKLTESAVNSSHECYRPIPANTGKHTLSLLAKAGTCTKFRLWLTQAANGYYAEVDLAAGTITPALAWGSGVPLGSSIAPLGGGEYRVTLSGAHGGGYYDIAMMNGSAWQYTGTGRTLYIKECQFEAGEATAYIPTTAMPVTIQGTRLQRTITPPTSVTKKMVICTAAESASDYEVFYHLDNNQNNANYADTELFRYMGSLYVRTTHQNTVYRETSIPVANDTVYTVAWTTSANGLKVSFNGSEVIELAGDTYNSGLTHERINGNLTGDRVAKGYILSDATWFNLSPTNAQLMSL
jgi:hypothetical protein